MEGPQPVRILLVEDSEEDALLLEGHLRAHGLACNVTRVEDLEPLRAELAKPDWDILLADFNLPAMDGLQVLGPDFRLDTGSNCLQFYWTPILG